MEFGFVFPGSDPAAAVRSAIAAERAGWDGFFVWEAPWGMDAWATLGAIATVTNRMRIGTLLTPLPVRPPWKVAAESATVDVLSGGRLILAVGLGAPDTGFEAFGLPTDRRVRADLLDEALAIVTGLWSGQPFSFSGSHYTIAETAFAPAPSPVQQRNGRPHVPIWVVGAWGRPKSMARVAAYDGMLPHLGAPDGSMLDPADLPLADIRHWLDTHADQDHPIDLIVEGTTRGDDRTQQREVLGPLREAGATWWIESLWDGDADAVAARLEHGPPVS